MLRIDLEEVQAAWNALQRPDPRPGWRSIRVASDLSLPVRAARKFPGGEPSILFGVHRLSIPSAPMLPQARGFRIDRAEDLQDAEVLSWLSITLLDQRDMGLFESMVVDLLEVLSGIKSSDGREKETTDLLINRIRAWQEFLSRGRFGLMSGSEEIGLFGELEIFDRMLTFGMDPWDVAESWKGPFDGIQDFSLGSGAIEVKTSISDSSFQARIGSLDQLDPSLAAPLFLAAVRLDQEPNGKTLPELVEHVLLHLEKTASASDRFRLGLLRAGYLDSHRDGYTRRFLPKQVRIIPVAGNFPKLTRGNVPKEITHAAYTIEMDSFPVPDIEFDTALIQLGVK